MKNGRLVANIINLLHEAGIGRVQHVCLDGPSASGSLLRFLWFYSLNFWNSGVFQYFWSVV